MKTCTEKKDYAFINATPININDYISIKSINFPLLDLPVRINEKESNSYYYSGYWATKIQFKYQFEFYTGKKIDISTLNKICNDIFD